MQAHATEKGKDGVRFRVFDVGVALVFEATAHFASVCFF